MSVRLTPYLVMNGNAKEAIEFYRGALGAEVMFLQTFAEMPDQGFPMSEEAKGLVSHAMLKVGETDLMFSDTFPGQPHSSGTQVTICITTNDKEQSRRFFDALSEGGNVTMPLTETFFSPAYGSVTDKFGVAFQIFTEGRQ